MIESLSTASKLLLSELIGTDDSNCSSQKSVFLRLKGYLENDTTKLDPCPALNSIFTRLVSLLQGCSYPSLNDYGYSFSDLERVVCGEIDGDERLKSRAEFVRDLAMRAEFHLELHYVRLMLSRTLTDTKLSPLDRLTDACCGFPYLDNYVDMVEKETVIINKFILNGNEQKSPKSIADTGEDEEWTRIVVFCGSGPLPLTGILMAMFLKFRVILVDCDEDAADLSGRLIWHWEKEEVIPVGVITVICAKAEDLTFYNPDSTILGPEVDNLFVPCHVLFIAGLIPNDVKEFMVRKVSQLEQAGPLVVMRTAHGLTARFAYFQTRRQILTKHLNLVGIVAPDTHRDNDGFVVDDHVRPIGFFSSKILNSLELYSWR